MNRRTVAFDLVIELSGAGIVAVIVWLATVSADVLAIPTWSVVTIAAAVTIAVASLIAYVVRARNLQRTEAALRIANDSADAAVQHIRSLRDLNRRLGEQLMLGDQLKILKSVTSYVVDPEGQDRSESMWILAYEQDHQGRAFTTDDWSSQPPAGEVTCTCQSDEGTSVLPVLIVDEPTNKQFVLYLHPPVGRSERTIQVRQTWPGMWDELRKNGTDYVELTARPGLQEAVTQIHIPLSIGQFKWVPNDNSSIKLSESVTGVQQTFTFSVPTPQAGMKYRADLVRR